MTTAATQVPAITKPAYTVRHLLLDKQKEILAALPRHITPAYFMRVVLTAVQRNPKLADCTSISLFGSILQCAQLGLVPDGFLGQAYLIPYDNKKKNVLEVQFQCGYRGLITLARRSGEISIIGAEVVYERDQFKQIRGLSPSVDHTPFEGDGDPGALVSVYAWYRLKDGGYDLTVMNRRQVHAIRNRSQAYRSGVQYGKKDSPWFTDEPAMWKKTAIKQLLKLAPLSVEIQRAAGLDDAAEAGLPQDLAILADPNAEATALLEGDGDDPPDDVIEMPHRASEVRTSLDVVATTGGRATTEVHHVVSPPVLQPGPFVDGVVDARPSGSGWAARLRSGVMVWTRDPALGAQLLAVPAGDVRRFTADPPDAQGRRKLTGLEA
jgi:recombination protein RecT